MKIIKQIIVAISIFSFLYPCSCLESPSPEEAYVDADVVFSGEVTSIVMDGAGYYYEVTFQIIDVWKGEIQDEIIILTETTSSECGYNFQINNEYLVYAYIYSNGIYTNICTRTNLLESAEEDLEYLYSLNNSEAYIFSENIRITESSNNQIFPEIAIGDNIIHLTWVNIAGNNKNIMYSKSDNYGEIFSNPIQINYLDNNIVAYGSQSGPKIKIFNNKVYITYTDNRSGLTSIYLNSSNDYGETWQEEILISDTPYFNAYQDFEVDNIGNLHLVYYNYAASNHLDDVRYRFSGVDDSGFHASMVLGVVTDAMEPCDCCQPDLEIDINGDIYVAYRNNEQNIRDTFIAVKRYGNVFFSEYYQASNLQDFIGFCPSSGPSLDINDNKIAVAYTSYNNQNVYTSISSLENMDFSNYINVNPDSDSFQNYPNILLDNNLHTIWVDQSGFDIYYGMRDVENNTMVYIQKINDDNTNSTQQDPIIYKQNDMLYSFWSDQRHGNYEIYFSKGTSESIIAGDINQDSVIDILDVVLIINIILIQYDPSIEEEIASDLNSDGIINIQDVILLINIILNI